MKIKFPYLSFPRKSTDAFPDKKYVLRPVIPIKVKCQEKEITYHALIDSGADFCIFHAQIGESIGINIKEGKKLKFFGVTGGKQEAYFHHILIEIGGTRKEYIVDFLIMKT